MGTFPETRWSLVLRAGSPDQAVSRLALNELLDAYTRPVDAYLLATGTPRQQVADVRQGFFLDLLTHGAFARVDPERKGRFRHFLKGALQKHLGHLREREAAIKRGGGRPDLSLEELPDGSDGSHAHAEAAGSNPEREFMRAWTVALVQRALDRLIEESRRGGRDGDMDAYGPFLTSDEEPDHRQLAARVGTNPGASRARLKRLRQRFHLLVREVVTETMDDPRDVDDELRFLLS